MLELHEQVDVAIRPKVGTQGRPENGKPLDPPASTERSEASLWYCYLWVHLSHQIAIGLVTLKHAIRVDFYPCAFHFPHEMLLPGTIIVHLDVQHSVVVGWHVQITFE